MSHGGHSMNTQSTQNQSRSALVQLAGSLALAIRLFFNSKVPLWAKIVPIIALIYVISPIDIVPDFIPGLGQIDDLTILLLGLWIFLQLVPKDLLREQRGETGVVEGDYRVVNDSEPVTTDAKQIAAPRGPAA
jgi:uncharacterized membrane protein YkvA (DUF1232 family)